MTLNHLIADSKIHKIIINCKIIVHVVCVCVFSFIFAMFQLSIELFNVFLFPSGMNANSDSLCSQLTYFPLFIYRGLFNGDFPYS